MENFIFCAVLVKLLSNYESTLSPKNLENISNIEDWDLTLVAYKKSLFDAAILSQQKTTKVFGQWNFWKTGGFMQKIQNRANDLRWSFLTGFWMSLCYRRSKSLLIRTLRKTGLFSIVFNVYFQTMLLDYFFGIKNIQSCI